VRSEKLRIVACEMNASLPLRDHPLRYGELKMPPTAVATSSINKVRVDKIS
jgi:hypothetical protein